MRVHMYSDYRSAYEERANSITHAIGAILAVIGTFFVVNDAMEIGGVNRILSSLLYGVSSTLGLTSSALFHATSGQPWRRKFRIIDHCAIYLMIAGGYSPLLLMPFEPGSGFLFFMAIWFLALLGVTVKIFFFPLPEAVSLSSYLLLGWIGLFLIEPLMDVIPLDGLYLLLGGGLCYTIGTFFYLNDHKKWFHTTWHLFTLAGCACHYFAIRHFVITL